MDNSIGKLIKISRALKKKKKNQHTHIITGVIISAKERSRYYYIAEDVGGVPTCLFW